MAPVPPMTALCESWDIDLSDCLNDADDALVEQAIAWASNELWGASGGTIGLCDLTAVICTRQRWPSYWCEDCPSYDVLDLGPGVVVSVASVTLPGAAVPMAASEWMVLDWRWLARKTGTWPVGGTVNGVTVSWTAGTPPDVSALAAAQTLACEWLLAKSNRPCRLLKDRDNRKDGAYGIPEVDAWVRNVQRGQSGIFDTGSVDHRYVITQQA